MAARAALDRLTKQTYGRTNAAGRTRRGRKEAARGPTPAIRAHLESHSHKAVQGTLFKAFLPKRSEVAPLSKFFFAGVEASKQTSFYGTRLWINP